MKLVWVSCSACSSEWDDLDRNIRPFCPSCGSKRVEKLLIGGQKRTGDVKRVPREERIDGMGFLLGVEALHSARESGDWDQREGQGDDPDDLEAEYWLARYRARLVGTLAKEEVIVTTEEEEAADRAFRRGWDWAVG